MLDESKLTMSGELSAKLLKGHNGVNRLDPGPRRKYIEGRGLIEYKDHYERLPEVRQQELGLWHWLKSRAQSMSLKRKMKSGKAARGRTNESD